ncbi:hypothetical protein ABZ478_38000 [Streptomyces sp. NPDC005706]|uniref:hypothetical protein n=1 Tax=Streptomyces sp. NPDC005706 TaxID=3157169 RepID=UPI0033FDF07B
MGQGISSGSPIPDFESPDRVGVPAAPSARRGRRLATELLRFGHSWAAVHAIHTARPSPAHPTGRYLLTLTPKAYAGTGVQAVHPDQ